MAGLIERNDKDIVGVLSCYDRVIIVGTLPGFGHSEGMTSYLRANGIRIFDYTKFAEPLRDQIRKKCEERTSLPASDMPTSRSSFPPHRPTRYRDTSNACASMASSSESDVGTSTTSPTLDAVPC
jgi:hypothetical protein